MEIKNAKIVSTMLGTEDHGIFTFMLTLDYGGSGQGAGGWCLDKPLEKKGKFIKRVGSPIGIDLIMAILDVVGVYTWEELKGKHIRAKADYDKVYAIGNLLKDKWLDFESFFKPKSGEGV